MWKPYISFKIKITFNWKKCIIIGFMYNSVTEYVHNEYS